MKFVDKIVENLLKQYVGGQLFFTALDKSIQHATIVKELFKISPKDCTIIVSGSFGQFIYRNFKKDNLLVLSGGLRHVKSISLEPYAEQIEGKDFIFIDDSYYLGRTRDVIRTEIERLKGNFLHTYVVYDGSKVKDPQLTSLYRYYERH